MNVEKILAISGKPGLFELKIQTRSGFVAESLLDGKKITVGMKSNVSLLSEISMYTHTEEKPLVEILRAIAVKENENVRRLREELAQMEKAREDEKALSSRLVEELSAKAKAEARKQEVDQPKEEEKLKPKKDNK